MSQVEYYEAGDYNAACSMCGRKFKASQLVKNWQGQYRCVIHNDTRNAQDFVRAVPDIQTPPWVQPPNTTYANFCTPNGQSAVPGQAEPGCMIPGYLSPSYNSASPI